jgi:hypothetical protein
LVQFVQGKLPRVGERSNADSLLVTYFTFIAFVASQSFPGGELRNWLHRSSIIRAG